MDLTSLEWIPLALLLAYTLPACNNDVKHREMPVGFWTALVTISAPITVLLYVTGNYPIEALGVSFGMLFVYFLMLLANAYQGADFWYLVWISLFFVTNPVSGHSLMALSYFIFLIASVVIFAIVMRLPPIKARLVSNNLPGFPMMLPISLALVLTVVFG